MQDVLEEMEAQYGKERERAKEAVRGAGVEVSPVSGRYLGRCWHARSGSCAELSRVGPGRRSAVRGCRWARLGGGEWDAQLPERLLVGH